MPQYFAVQAIDRCVSDPKGQFSVVGTVRTHGALRPRGRLRSIHGGDLILLPQLSPGCAYQTPHHIVPIPEVGRLQDQHILSGFDCLAPNRAAPPSVKPRAFMKPMVFHASLRILATSACCHWRARHIHWLRPRLCRVHPALSLDLEWPPAFAPPPLPPRLLYSLEISPADWPRRLPSLASQPPLWGQDPVYLYTRTGVLP